MNYFLPRPFRKVQRKKILIGEYLRTMFADDNRRTAND
jgi:hypothetical protein